MDIEKLKSIIRLANNNPNEHEANLAARKACKILAENDFALFKQTRTAADKIYGVSNPTGRNTGTWNDVKRSTEPQWKSKSYDGPGSPEARAYQEDWFKKWNNYWKQAEKEPAQGNTSWDKETNYDSRNYKAKVNWTKDYPFDDKPKKKESRIKKCSKCGVEVSTFRFKEEPFVCTVCHWKDL